MVELETILIFFMLSLWFHSSSFLTQMTGGIAWSAMFAIFAFVDRILFRNQP